MKMNLIISMMTLAFSFNSFADAICRQEKARVVVKNTQSISVRGLEAQGIDDGSYSCQVLSVGPGYLSIQSSIQCRHFNDPENTIMVWMVEGLSMWGTPAASVALYSQGNKVFEAGCQRQ